MAERRGQISTEMHAPTPVRCAIYTRKSTEEGLDQTFNSLDAQREAAEAYIRSQLCQGWALVPARYDDGGFSGGNLERPALHRLLLDIEAGRVNCVVVYKVDRLSRSLLDFAKLMERFDRQAVSFVAVTQQLNTTNSLGRLTLNILLSFAQFEREIIGERTRDKMQAARRKGKWSGGIPVLGYDVAPEGRRLVVNEAEAEKVREIFRLYTRHRSLAVVLEELNRRGWKTKAYQSQRGRPHGGGRFQEATLLRLLTNVLYIGKVEYRGELYRGEQAGVVEPSAWEPIQEELRTRLNRASKKRNGLENALLNGLLFCHLCERPMAHTYAVAHGRQYRYYVCRQPHQKGLARCPVRAVAATAIEQSVLAQLQQQVGGKAGLWESGEMKDFVRKLVEHVSYDGITGGVRLRLATIDSGRLNDN
jgi:site-specific DNA recombinase